MQELKIFEEKQIRTIWDEVQEKWYFSIVDIVQILTESKDYLTARKYWNKLKQRLLAEGNETVTNCHQLKLRAADGKLRYSDVADLEQMLRLIQSIPSPKAEPFKRWLAQVGAERTGIDRTVTWLNPTTGEPEPRPIYEVLSSHSARKAFAGNMYKNVKDPNLVCALTGHKEGSKAFNRYRMIDEETNRQTMSYLE